MKSRKIGVLTMGLTLVAFGVLFLLRTFIPEWDHISVMRFWPVVLIGLGLEVLITALIPQKEGQPRAKVDALSIVVLFLTLFLAFGLAAGQFVVEQINEHDWGRWRGSVPINSSFATAELGDGLYLEISSSAHGNFMTMEYTVHTDGSVYEAAWLDSTAGNLLTVVHRVTEERYAGRGGGRFEGGNGAGWAESVGYAEFEFWNLYNVSPRDFELRYRIAVMVPPDGGEDAQSRLFEGTVEL